MYTKDQFHVLEVQLLPHQPCSFPESKQHDVPVERGAVHEHGGVVVVVVVVVVVGGAGGAAAAAAAAVVVHHVGQFWQFLAVDRKRFLLRGDA